MPSAAPPPEFFVDRSLGRYEVPNALRAHGLAVRAMFEVYPEDEQRIEDEVWLRDVGERGWIVLTKDERIRRLAVEIAAIREGRAKVFYLANANQRGDEQAEMFVRHRHRIVQRAAKPGPFVYAVYHDRIELMFPRS